MKLDYISDNIEFFMQNFWRKNKIFNHVDLNLKPKYYSLCMFPYPSGKLHIGHIRNYTIGDIMAGYARLKKFNVLNPIGWDSFGLPAENAAYKNFISPDIWTNYNIINMRFQLMRLGFSFDWSKELSTSNPNYFKWEQLFFIKLYKSGLVYRKNGIVNWDPVDKTVLANEQVINGRGWRSNALIKKINIKQWYIKITDYADDLLIDLDYLDGWPNKVKDMQKNWINKKFCFEILFFLNKIAISLDNIFTIFLLKKIIISKNLYSHTSFLKDEISYIYNPITKCKIKIELKNNNDTNNIYNLVFFHENKLNLFRNIFFSSIKKQNLKMILIKILFLKKVIKKVEIFNLQDWCISRQRYWGTPIPFFTCVKCGLLNENENNLPVILPKIKKKKFKNISLNHFKRFKYIKCYVCESDAFRETDTFDTFFESSWYYIKYLAYNNINLDHLNNWLPVDQYIGGIEHATMHLIYARFFHKIFKDFGIVLTNEPFLNLLTQGMVLMSGSKISKSKGNIPDQEFLINKYGADTLRLFVIFSAPLDQSFEWTNNGIIGCKKFIKRIWVYAYLLSGSDFYKNCLFDEKTFSFNDISTNLIIKFNNFVDKIYFNLNKKISFNVIIALLMQVFKILPQSFNNSLELFFLSKRIFKFLIIFLSPIIPHVTGFIWTYILKECTNISSECMPQKIENIFLKNQVFNIMVFVNNKFKFNLNFFNKKISENELFNHPDLKSFLYKKKIKKFFYKENKLVNFIF